MRHLGSLIAGIVAVPLGWLLLAFGQTSSATAFARLESTGTYHAHDFARPLVFLVVAGIVVGLVASLRISPVGPAVAGAVYAGSYVALLIAPRRVYDLLNYRITVFHQPAELLAPLTTGACLAIGAALLVAVVSVGRWRRWPRPEAPPAVDEGTGEEPAEQPPALSDNTVTSPSWNPFESVAGSRDAEATDATIRTASSDDLPARTASSDDLPAGTASSGDLPARTASSGDLPTPRTSAGDLPVRTPGTWPPSGATAGQDETEPLAGRGRGTGAAVKQQEASGESEPVRGRSPWDTPLGDPNSRQ